MARGFLSGVLWGAVVSVGVAGIASVLSQDLNAPAVSSAVPAVSEAPLQGAPATARSGADADLALEAGAGSGTTRPEADDVSAAAQAGADTPTVPQTGTAEDLSGPAEAADSGRVDVGSVTPVAPERAVTKPDTPAPVETALSISTDPAQPVAPEVPTATQAFEVDPDADTAPEAPAQEADVVETAALPQSPSSPGGAASEPVVTTRPASPPASGEAANAGTAPAVRNGDIDLPSTLDPGPDENRPRIGALAGSLIDREIEEAEQPDAAEVPTLPDPDLPPIRRYAVNFESEGDAPLMSIVLIDDGVVADGDTIGLAALRSFPYPLSFAVNVELPDATDRMRLYRAEGFEVLAMIDLPSGATGRDAEIALAAAMDAVPEAVGVLEGLGTGVQSDRNAAEQMIEALGASGHGFLLQAKGLNTIQKLAARDGVPSAVVFRDFDGAGQSQSQMRRFLDQAAFRAGQEGRVVMLGRLRPETISALLLWGLQDRPSRVSLAPVSAVLSAGAGEG